MYLDAVFYLKEERMKSQVWTKSYQSRRSFIGGSDTRTIMGSDEAALIRLWRDRLIPWASRSTLPHRVAVRRPEQRR